MYYYNSYYKIINGFPQGKQRKWPGGTKKQNKTTSSNIYSAPFEKPIEKRMSLSNIHIYILGKDYDSLYLDPLKQIILTRRMEKQVWPGFCYTYGQMWHLFKKEGERERGIREKATS